MLVNRQTQISQFSTFCPQNPSVPLFFQLSFETCNIQTSTFFFHLFICLDVDECTTGQHSCSLNADCLNTQASYSCACKMGYTGNGTFCNGKACTTLAKKLLQPKISWGWSWLRSCDIVWYWAAVRHRCDSRYLRVASWHCRSKSMSNDISWLHCRSISRISRL